MKRRGSASPASVSPSCISASRKAARRKSLAALKNFLAPLEIADFDLKAAQVYGQVRKTLEAAGTPIGPLDTQIAAHARARRGAGDE
jgi:Predicted nucleic acid-binding protein, contains PIN domain